MSLLDPSGAPTSPSGPPARAGLAPEDEAAVDRARLAQNLRRMLPALGLLLPVSLLAVFVLSRAGDGLSPERLRWRQLLAGAHGAVLVVLLALALLAWRASRRPETPPRWSAPLALATALAGLQAGAWIAGIDQLVTTAITPFVIVNFGVALLVRLRVWQAAAVHLLGLLAFTAAVALFQRDADGRASALLNGLTVSTLALALSAALTRAFERAERARHLILRQGRELDQLRGLLRVCSYCKRIKDAERGWEPLEAYVSRHSEARFSHGMCEACFERHVGPLPDPDPVPAATP